LGGVPLAWILLGGCENLTLTPPPEPWTEPNES